MGCSDDLYPNYQPISRGKQNARPVIAGHHFEVFKTIP
jgi:hypothetical protein